MEISANTARTLISIVKDALIHRHWCEFNFSAEVPVDLLAPALRILEAGGTDTAKTREFLAAKGVIIPRDESGNSGQIDATNDTVWVVETAYVRRAKNQVSADVEALIRELLERGWSKSRISRVLRVNRRVVIRVAQERPDCTST